MYITYSKIVLPQLQNDAKDLGGNSTLCKATEIWQEKIAHKVNEIYALTCEIAVPHILSSSEF